MNRSSNSSKPVKIKLAVVLIAISAMASLAWSGRFARPEVTSMTSSVEVAALPDDAKAKAAFNEAAKVFFSARCANCHPAGDIPTQGDEMTPHTMAVTRGKDGFGLYGQRCDTCHQRENLPGEHMPPGTSKAWHMPPSGMPMVFQGLTAGELCRNFKDPRKNGGNRTAKDAMDHIQKKDPLVMWAWEPGNGRTLPPMTFAEFSAKVEEWVSNGGACPD